MSDKKNLALRGHGQNSQLVFLMADLKKLTGRPLISDGKRSKKITARFSEDEYKQIVTLGKTLGLSKTDLVRVRVLNEAKKIVINAGELIRCLDAIGAEMGRAGNNINQLAIHDNTLRLKNALIADELKLSENTVKHHRTNMFEKCEVNNMAELIAKSLRNGWFN